MISDKELSLYIKKIKEHIEAGKEPSIAKFRETARACRALSKAIRKALEMDPGLEHWWQQERLANGWHDSPTLYLLAKQTDVIGEYFKRLADELTKENRRARAKG